MDKHQELLSLLRTISHRLDRMEETIRDVSQKLETVSDSEPLTVNFKRAAELSGLSVSGLRRHADRGYFEVTKVGGRLLVNVASLKEFLRVGIPLKRDLPPPPPPPPPLPVPSRRRLTPDYTAFDRPKKRKKKS